MRHPVYRCEVCSKYHAAADGRLVRIHYPPADAPADRKGHGGFAEVAEWHCGVRALCRWCVEAVRALPAAPPLPAQRKDDP